MDLSSYLRFHRVEECDFMSALRDVIVEVPGGALALAGSLIEGTGNHRSDIDAYVIAPVPDDGRLSFSAVQVVAIRGLMVDIEYVDPVALRRLTDTLAMFPSTEIRDQRPSATALSMAEAKVLHNLLLAHPIYGADVWCDKIRAIDAPSLARLLFDFCSVSIDMIQEDTLGFLEVGDSESGRTLLRMLRQYLGGAMLAAFGETNPAEKWRSLKLRRLKATHGDTCLPGGRSLRDAVDFWCDADAAIAREEPSTMLADLLQLADAVLPWALERFHSGLPLGVVLPTVPSQSSANEGADSPVLPALSLDTRIRRDEQGIWISRIGSPRRIYVNDLGYELLLQFNGHTQAGCAATRLFAAADVECEEAHRCIDHFATILSHERMIWEGGML